MLNRGAWVRIESAVRRLAEKEGELYVVTGPVFEGADLQARGRVLVPTSTYKAVYDPAANTAGAYVCTNTNEPECRVVSVAALASLTGIDPFPGVPDGIKAVAAPLPLPRARRGGARDPWLTPSRAGPIGTGHADKRHHEGRAGVRGAEGGAAPYRGPPAGLSRRHAELPHGPVCRGAGARSGWAEPPAETVACPACLKRLAAI
jgi:DNA/RNA non-specific endonuclease